MEITQLNLSGIGTKAFDVLLILKSKVIRWDLLFPTI
jgi:hypothetical protein